MPMHDWKRVTPNVYHDFHGLWLMAIRHALNHGLLPPGYYALFEQVTRNVQTDLLTLRKPTTAPKRPRREQTAPTGGLMQKARRATFKRPDRRVAIRHSSGHDIVAAVELVSRANKASRNGVAKFVDKAESLLDAGVHLLMVDPLPPTRPAPHGLHPLVWAAATKPSKKKPYAPPADRPLTAVSYQAADDDELVASVEAFAVGSRLPDMPLWLTEDLWVPVPLEAAYEAAYAEVPPLWQVALGG